MRRLMLVLGVGLALSACGSAGEPSSATGDDADAARLRFEKCLRDNGVETVRDGAGKSGVVRVDDAKANDAMQACDDEREAAFGKLTDEQRQEFRDAFAKFSACMRRHGVDLPDPGQPDDGRAAPRAAARRLEISPKMQAAMKACEDDLPARRGKGGGGPVLVGPGPGAGK